MECEHCGVTAASPADLGAHGIAHLCDACTDAVIYDRPCPLGDRCPEGHGQEDPDVAADRYQAMAEDEDEVRREIARGGP